MTTMTTIKLELRLRHLPTICIIQLLYLIQNVNPFSLYTYIPIHTPTKISPSTRFARNNNKNNNEGEPLDYDDDDFWDSGQNIEDDEDALLISSVTEKQQQNNANVDLSGCSARQFSLGYDIRLNAFAASSGFEQVTDWEYYTTNDDDDDDYYNKERKVVKPSPLDPNQPKRTREKSGSVVRIFRGELIGRFASTARSKGLDIRVLVKEFSGEYAIRLAQAEILSISKMQSKLSSAIDVGAKQGEWLSSASRRYINGRVNGSTKEDDENLLKLMTMITTSKSLMPYVAILGELNLSEFFEDKNTNLKNEWYSALGVAPPKPGSIWLVYEYAGVSTVGIYSQPALKRWSNLPPQRGVFGNVMPPSPLPKFQDRQRYVVNGIMKGCLEALATVHNNDVSHRSIGRNSIILSSVGQDKQEASSPYAIVISRLCVKLGDFGFSGSFSQASNDEDFRSRARAFKLNIQPYSNILECKSFAIAEDLHALGLVFVGLLLSSLAQIPTEDYRIPPTDEESLQRLVSDIFDNDMDEFREYCEAEEVWGNVVSLLDENGGAGWNVLEQMLFAREKVKDNLERGLILTADGLLQSSFFSSK